jgi:hypothetical protein
MPLCVCAIANLAVSIDPPTKLVDAASDRTGMKTSDVDLIDYGILACPSARDEMNGSGRYIAISSIAKA